MCPNTTVPILLTDGFNLKLLPITVSYRKYLTPPLVLCIINILRFQVAGWLVLLHQRVNIPPALSLSVFLSVLKSQSCWKHHTKLDRKKNSL